MTARPLNIAREVAALERMTAKQLRDRFAEVFGEPTHANNRTWLVRRIGWRLQVLAEGDLSERAKARAAELACDADLRVTPPRVRPEGNLKPASRRVEMNFAADARLPPPGTILTRKYKRGEVQVQVLADGFEYAGDVYRTLSAVAKAVTGTHCNGFAFFRLTGKERAA